MCLLGIDLRDCGVLPVVVLGCGCHSEQREKNELDDSSVHVDRLLVFQRNKDSAIFSENKKRH
jgi:hypothetical protein